VAGHGEDRPRRRVGALERPDRAGCRDAVHDGHPDVHEDRVKCAGRRFGKPLDRIQAVDGANGPGSHVGEQPRRALRVEIIVLAEKDGAPGKLRRGDGLAGAGDLPARSVRVEKRKIEIEREGGALPGLAFNRDGPMHQLYQVLDDGKSQTAAGILCGKAVVLLRKGVEKARLHELPAHADTRVAEDKAVMRQIRLLAARLQRQIDRAAGGGKLDRVGQKVHEHLAQPQLIGQRIYVEADAVVDDLKGDVLFLQAGPEHVVEAVHKFTGMERRGLQLELFALQLAEIERVVDQSQQIVAGLADLADVLAEHLRALFVARKRHKAQDSIHRRAHVMAHAGVELGLGGAGGIGLTDSLGQFLILSAQFRSLPKRPFRFAQLSHAS